MNVWTESIGGDANNSEGRNPMQQQKRKGHKGPQRERKGNHRPIFALLSVQLCGLCVLSGFSSIHLSLSQSIKTQSLSWQECSPSVFSGYSLRLNRLFNL